MRLVRLVSVTAVATATCALWALPASAATASHARHPTTTSVSVSPSPAWVGQRVRLSARVRSSVGTPTGTVAFLSFGRTMCVAHLLHGAGSCNSSFGAVNTYIVRGFYSGDRTHRGSVGATTVTVRRSPTITRITGPNAKIDVGGTFTFPVTVTVPAGTPAATGTVKLAPVIPTKLPGYTCTATLVAGKGTCTVKPFEFGIDNYKATYTGNGAHRGSVSNGKFLLAVLNKTTTVVPATMATAGSVTLTALVRTVGPVGANITAPEGRGTVVFSLSSMMGSVGNPVTMCTGGTGATGAAVLLTTFTGAPDFNNVATCTGSPTLNGLAKGTYFISAVFSGDDVNEPSSTTTVGTLTVN
jgi:Bacterial Ig-like domain (group 3)